jgi:hypothetical protein
LDIAHFQRDMPQSLEPLDGSHGAFITQPGWLA